MADPAPSGNPKSSDTVPTATPGTPPSSSHTALLRSQMSEMSDGGSVQTSNPLHGRNVSSSDDGKASVPPQVYDRVSINSDLGIGDSDRKMGDVRTADSHRVFVSPKTGLWSRFRDAAVTARHKTFPYANNEGGIPFATKIVYALPQISLTSLTLLIGIHGTLFYNSIGADVAFIAFFTAFARSFDVITDPLMGWYSDKTRSPMGRRRPYMARGLLGYGIMFILLFSPPSSFSGTSSALWFGFFYVLFYAFDTIANVPYSALGPELSDISSERDSLFFWSKLINGIGILMAAVGPVMLAIGFRDCDHCDVECPLGPAGAAEFNVTWNPEWGSLPSSDYNTTSCPTSGDFTNMCCGLEPWCQCREDCEGACDVDASRKAMMSVALFFGLCYVIFMGICVCALRERETSSLSEAPPLIPSLIATMRNKPFVGLLPAWILDACAYAMLGSSLPFFVEYVVDPASVPECEDGKRAAFGLDKDGQDPSKESENWCKAEVWLGLGLVMLIGAQIIAMPLWLFLTKKMGKFRTWLTFNLTNSVTNALFVFVGSGDPKLCVLLAIVNGIPAGAQFLTDSVVADVIDYDEFHTGLRSEGRFTIFQTFIPKIVSIPAQAIPLALLSMVGFIPPENGVPQKQPERVITFIKVVFFVIPSILSISSFFIKRRFPIKSKEIIDKVSEGIALHMKGAPAVDPLTGQTVSLLDLTDEERRITCDLDSFFPRQLKQLLTPGGAERVAAQIRRSRLISGVLLAVFLTITIIIIGLGGLTDESIAWIPAFTIILAGIALTSLGFHHVRLKTAVNFVEKPVDQHLLRRWIKHIFGTDDGFGTNATLAANVLKLQEREVEVVSKTTKRKKRVSVVELVDIKPGLAPSGPGTAGLRRRDGGGLSHDM